MLKQVQYGLAGVLAMAVVLSGGTPTAAQTIPVGTGSSSAGVYIEFQDGAIYEFDVSFDGSPTGIGLFDLIEADTSLTTVRGDFGFGVFIDGITFDGHSNVGYGGGDDWWHYWVREPGGVWMSSSVGAGARVLSDGASDGWVYGHGGAPVPEPQTLTLALIAAGFITARRRCTSTL